MYPTSDDVKNANTIEEKRRLGTLWYINIVSTQKEKLKQLKTIESPTKEDVWNITFLEGCLT